MRIRQQFAPVLYLQRSSRGNRDDVATCGVLAHVGELVPVTGQSAGGGLTVTTHDGRCRRVETERQRDRTAVDSGLSGATAGSGAVRFFRRKAIRVTPTRGLSGTMIAGAALVGAAAVAPASARALGRGGRRRTGRGRHGRCAAGGQTRLGAPADGEPLVVLAAAKLFDPRAMLSRANAISSDLEVIEHQAGSRADRRAYGGAPPVVAAGITCSSVARTSALRMGA